MSSIGSLVSTVAGRGAVAGLALGESVKQPLQLPGWWRWRPRPPAARQHAPGDQPGPHPSQRRRPRTRGSGFGADAHSPAPPAQPTRRPSGQGVPVGRGLGQQGLPAEREGAAHQGPVPADGPVAADLEVGPAQLPLDLLVTLLDPVTQPIQPHHLSPVGLLAAAGGGPGQVGQQVPAAVPWQPSRVGGGHDQPQPTAGTPAAELGISRPPGLGLAVAETPSDSPPLPRPVRAAPAEVAGRLDRGVGCSAGAQVPLRGLSASTNGMLAGVSASVKPGLSP
jgi:hypothetical protein